MEDDGEVCDGDRLSAVNKLDGKELKIGDSQGVASGYSGAESGVSEK